MKRTSPSSVTIGRRRTGTTTSRFNVSTDELQYIDYKNVKLLRRYMSRYMKIEPRRRTGLTAKQQRNLANALKRARFLALVPYTIT